MTMAHFAKRIADQFDKFVKAPQLFEGLWCVNSKVKKLQPRQRETLVKVVRVLLEATEAEYNQIGVCKSDNMEGITHKALMTRYRKKYGEDISEGRWYRAYKHLTEVGYIESKHALVIDRIGEEEQPVIRSIASMKCFTQKFLNAVNVEHKQDVRDSRKKCIQDRIKKGLSNIWSGYKIFNTLRKKPLDAPESVAATYDDVDSSYDDHIFI